jgi:hypothetical protein
VINEWQGGYNKKKATGIRYTTILFNKMLAGIKKGKRKRKNSKNESSSSLSSSSNSQSKKKSTTQMLNAAVSGPVPVPVINNVTVMNDSRDTRNVNNHSSGGISSDKKNCDAAAELRQML